VQIAHMKLSGTDSWGQADRLHAAIDAARSRGVDVHGDQYPYDWATNPLRFLLPSWLHEGGISATLERLADPYVRSRMEALRGSHRPRSGQCSTFILVFGRRP